MPSFYFRCVVGNAAWPSDSCSIKTEIIPKRRGAIFTHGQSSLSHSTQFLKSYMERGIASIYQGSRLSYVYGLLGVSATHLWPQGVNNFSKRGEGLFKMKETETPILLSTHHIFTRSLHMHHQTELSVPPNYLSNGPHHTISPLSSAVLIQNSIISHLGTGSWVLSSAPGSLHSQLSSGSSPLACNCAGHMPGLKFFSGS